MMIFSSFSARSPPSRKTGTSRKDAPNTTVVPNSPVPAGRTTAPVPGPGNSPWVLPGAQIKNQVHHIFQSQLMVETEAPEAYQLIVAGILKVSFPNGIPWMGIDVVALEIYIDRFIAVELPCYDHQLTTMGWVPTSFLKWIKTQR